MRKLIPIIVFIIALTIGAGAVSAEGVMLSEDSYDGRFFDYDIDPSNFSLVPYMPTYSPIPKATTPANPAPILAVVLGLGIVCATLKRN